MEPSETELEKFRQKWREEVSAKAKGPAKSNGESSSAGEKRRSATALKSTKRQNQLAPVPKPRDQNDGADEAAPQPYHNLDDSSMQSGRKLGDDDYGSKSRSKEPETALEHYERAVEKETQGSLGDSLRYYRKAFRMDPSVDKKYKSKHFPPSAFPPAIVPATSSSSKQPATVPSTAHPSLTALPPTIAELISSLSDLAITGELAPTDLSPPPPCPISNIPEEILSQILLNVAIADVASFSRLALVCKRLAFLVLTEDSIWKRVVHGHVFGFAGMHYTYICTLLGTPIESSTLDSLPAHTTSPLPTLPLSPSLYPTYRSMFKLRPRLRFNGVYISTVNYTRPSSGGANSVTWNSPVLIVTYYRYLRFFRSGRVISLLTTAEPADVVPWLHMEHVHHNYAAGGALPQAVMKDALRGRWRLSGDPFSRSVNKASGEGEKGQSKEEPEGDVLIETEGVVPRYMYKMHLSLSSSAGNKGRNNKLVWRGYWNWNKLTDDWGEFGLKNYRPFYWSRVRSYGNGL